MVEMLSLNYLYVKQINDYFRQFFKINSDKNVLTSTEKELLFDLRLKFMDAYPHPPIELKNCFWHQYGHISEALRVGYHFTCLILYSGQGTDLFYLDPNQKGKRIIIYKHLQVCLNVPPKVQGLPLYFDPNYSLDVGSDDFVRNFKAIALGGIIQDLKQLNAAQNIEKPTECFKSKLRVMADFGLFSGNCLKGRYFKKRNDSFFFVKADILDVLNFNIKSKTLSRLLFDQNTYNEEQYKRQVGSYLLPYQLYIMINDIIHT